MSLLKIAVEKLPPTQRSSLEVKQINLAVKVFDAKYAFCCCNSSFNVLCVSLLKAKSVIYFTASNGMVQETVHFYTFHLVYIRLFI